jgi:hypothetical protein
MWTAPACKGFCVWFGDLVGGGHMSGPFVRTKIWPVILQGFLVDNSGAEIARDRRDQVAAARASRGTTSTRSANRSSGKRLSHRGAAANLRLPAGTAPPEILHHIDLATFRELTKKSCKRKAPLRFHMTALRLGNKRKAFLSDHCVLLMRLAFPPTAAVLIVTVCSRQKRLR